MVRPPPMHPDRLAWGSIPAVGLLARGLWALAFPGFCPVVQVRPFTAYSCGGSSGLTGKPAHRIPCYPPAGTVGVSALANRLPPVEPQASMVACRAFRESHADTQRTPDLDRKPVPELPVTDVERAQQYDRDVLGFAIGWLDPSNAIGAVCRGEVAIFLRKRQPPFEPAVHWMFAPDVGDIYRELSASGADICRADTRQTLGLAAVHDRRPRRQPL